MVSYIRSLEHQLQAYVICEVNTRRWGNLEFLYSNEYNPESVEDHLKLAQRGIIVSTGTERSFFDILFCPAGKCEGLVVRDVNPRVKAYVDFNTLLLRLSESREEYRALSSPLDPSRFQVITDKLQKASLPEKIKEYYLNNLYNFGEVYFGEERAWRFDPEDEPYFEGCRYDLDDALFEKLHTLAIEGNIIATIGDINDLSFLDHRKVSVVDTSNIHNYSFINLNVKGNPRVIHTEPGEYTSYFSHKHFSISPGEKEEFDYTLVQLGLDPVHPFLPSTLKTEDPFDHHGWPVYSRKTLSLLKKNLHPSLKIKGPITRSRSKIMRAARQ